MKLIEKLKFLPEFSKKNIVIFFTLLLTLVFFYFYFSSEKVKNTVHAQLNQLFQLVSSKMGGILETKNLSAPLDSPQPTEESSEVKVDTTETSEEIPEDVSEVLPADVPVDVPVEVPSTPRVTKQNQKKVMNPSKQKIDRKKPTFNRDQIKVYEVKERKTLLMIAFEIYGDYRMWTDLKELNPNLNSSRIKIGNKINYHPPTENFLWPPSGEPYVIKKRDTLQKISFGYYLTTTKWKMIWKHNEQLIIDPDDIFYGLTIYLRPEEKGKF
jgi:nucleoid-associated protein YgaU